MLVLALLSAASAASAAPLPLNPNYEKRHHRRHRVAVSTDAVAGLSIHLVPGRWKPEVRLAIERLAFQRGDKSPGYDPRHPPVAVLPLDDAFIDGDLGELAFWRLVRRAEFKFDDEFWNIVPVAYGRQKTRAAYEQFSGLSQAIWQQQPTYAQYCKFFVRSYQDVCSGVGRKECRVYLARLWRGFAFDQAQAYVSAVWDEESRRDVSVDAVAEYPGDPFPARMRRGLVVEPEMQNLANFLRATGFQVWLESADESVVVRTAAAKLGLEPRRAVGIELTSFQDHLKSGVVEPVPMRGGKVEAIVTATGGVPALVVGAGPEDVALLSYGSGLRVLLDSGEPHIHALALKSGWLAQPAFVSHPR